MKKSIVLFFIALCIFEVFSYQGLILINNKNIQNILFFNSATSNQRASGGHSGGQAAVPPPVGVPVPPMPYPVPVVMPFFTFDDGFGMKKQRPKKNMRKRPNHHKPRHHRPNHQRY